MTINNYNIQKPVNADRSTHIHDSCKRKHKSADFCQICLFFVVPPIGLGILYTIDKDNIIMLVVSYCRLCYFSLEVRL